MAERRNGRAFLWATWVAAVLGGNQCLYAPWFKGRHRYEKYEPGGGDLVRWQADHDALMRRVRDAAVADGYAVAMEAGNAFKLEGQVAIVSGRPDLIATRDREVRVVDGKTGQRRQSDFWQMLIYLFALPRCRKDLVEGRSLVGVLRYRDDEVVVLPTELTAERVALLTRTIRTVAAAAPPPATPSAHECARCNIGPADCQWRTDAPPATAQTTEF